MNILVTGANGQLGNEMRALSAENQQHTYFFTDVQELDICDEQAIRTFVAGNRVDVIVNCAAYTAVDKAEDNPELCDKLNHVAPGYLAAAAEAVRRRMEQGQTQKDAVKAVSAEAGVKKNALYRYVLENEE